MATSAKRSRKLLRIMLFNDKYDRRKAGWTGPFVHREATASSTDYSKLVAEFTARKSRKVDFVQAARSRLMSCIFKHTEAHYFHYNPRTQIWTHRLVLYSLAPKISKSHVLFLYNRKKGPRNGCSAPGPAYCRDGSAHKKKFSPKQHSKLQFPPYTKFIFITKIKRLTLFR